MMIEIPVEVPRMGDGYLSIDWRDWLGDRAEYSPELTDSLRETLDAVCVDYPADEDITSWAREHWHAERTTGLYGDGDSWNIHTDGDNVLSCGYFGGLYFTVDNGPSLFVLTVIPGAYWSDKRPDVWIFNGDDDSEIADWSRAYGACDNPKGEHAWYTDDSVTMYRDEDSRESYRITDRAVKPPEICEDTDGYIRCTCGYRVRWFAA